MTHQGASRCRCRKECIFLGVIFSLLFATCCGQSSLGEVNRTLSANLTQGANTNLSNSGEIKTSLTLRLEEAIDSSSVHNSTHLEGSFSLGNNTSANVTNTSNTSLTSDLEDSISKESTNATELNQSTAALHFEYPREAIAAIRFEIEELCDYYLRYRDTNMAAKFLRLAFHDAVGGADGCVDISQGDNNGLEIPIMTIQPLVEKYSEWLSRADIWALAALAGVEMYQRFQGPKISFPMYYYGRVDCDEDTSRRCRTELDSDIKCSATTGEFQTMPSPDLTTHELLHYFREIFAFTARETVVAMGAHTFGVSDRFNSGFSGPRGWVDTRNIIDNEYYVQLVGGTLRSRMISRVDDAPHWGHQFSRNDDLEDIASRFMWIRRSQATTEETGSDISLVMLTSDIAIVRNLENEIDSETKRVSCDFVCREEAECRLSNPRRCPYSVNTLNMAAELKANNTQFVLEFSGVLNKMFTTGYDTSSDCIPGSNEKCLYLVDSTNIPPTTAPTTAPSTARTTVPSVAPTGIPSMPPSPNPSIRAEESLAPESSSNIFFEGESSGGVQTRVFHLAKFIVGFVGICMLVFS